MVGMEKYVEVGYYAPPLGVGNIPAMGDLNDCNTEFPENGWKIYIRAYGSTPVENAPETQNHYCSLLSITINSFRILQIFAAFGLGNIYYRYAAPSGTERVWSAWSKVATE